MDSYANPPAIVIYIVDAFLGSSAVRSDGGEEEEGDEVEAGSIWLLGLLRCYTEMLQSLPETMRPALVLQVKKKIKKIERENQQESTVSHPHLFISPCVGGAVSVSTPACQWREPLVLTASSLHGLLLLLPVQTSSTPADTYQVPDWLWTSVHCQLCAEGSRGEHED